MAIIPDDPKAISGWRYQSILRLARRYWRVSNVLVERIDIYVYNRTTSIVIGFGIDQGTRTRAKIPRTGW